jgi:hypothetical protein
LRKKGELWRKILANPTLLFVLPGNVLNRIYPQSGIVFLEQNPSKNTTLGSAAKIQFVTKKVKKNKIKKKAKKNIFPQNFWCKK